MQLQNRALPLAIAVQETAIAIRRTEDRAYDQDVEEEP
jgi:hypothetical protein